MRKTKLYLLRPPRTWLARLNDSSLILRIRSAARSFWAASCWISSCLKGQAFGMPGSLGSRLFSPDFLASLRFFRWCSLTLRRILYFWRSVVRLDLDFFDFFGMLTSVGEKYIY